MITATIGELLAGKFQVIFEEPGMANSFVIRDIDVADVSSTWFKQHCIYLVRDEQTTFYHIFTPEGHCSSHMGMNGAFFMRYTV